MPSSNRPTPTHTEADDAAEPSFGMLLRELIVFEVKLFMDGLKDVVLAQGAVLAVIIGFLRRRGRAGPLRALMLIGERFDRWLGLYDPGPPGAPAEPRSEREQITRRRDDR